MRFAKSDHLLVKIDHIDFKTGITGPISTIYLTFTLKFKSILLCLVLSIEFFDQHFKSLYKKVCNKILANSLLSGGYFVSLCSSRY